MKNAIYTLCLGLFVLSMAACKGGESISTNPASLQGDWQIVAMNGEEIPSQARDSHTISFNTDGTVAGLASCNRFAGTYNAQMEGRVTMNDVSATKVKCESESTTYLDALTSSSSFRVMGGDELELTSSTNSNTLIFSKVMAAQEQ